MINTFKYISTIKNNTLHFLLLRFYVEYTCQIVSKFPSTKLKRSSSFCVVNIAWLVLSHDIRTFSARLFLQERYWEL